MLYMLYKYNKTHSPGWESLTEHTQRLAANRECVSRFMMVDSLMWTLSTSDGVCEVSPSCFQFLFWTHSSDCSDVTWPQVERQRQMSECSFKGTLPQSDSEWAEHWICTICAQRVCVRVSETVCVHACVQLTSTCLSTLRSASVDKMYMLHYKLVQFSAWNLCTGGVCMANMHTTYLYKCI